MFPSSLLTFVAGVRGTTNTGKWAPGNCGLLADGQNSDRGNQADEFSVAAVSSGFFEQVGARATLGRLLSENDQPPTTIMWRSSPTRRGEGVLPQDPECWVAR